MTIQYNLLQRGFKNIPSDKRATGFQLLMKTAYYRGVALSLIQDIEVVVDGGAFDRSKIRFKVGDTAYSLDKMARVADVHWPWLEPATIMVQKPGGLTPGVHDVQVVVKLRISYMPFNPVPQRFNAKLVLMGDTSVAKPTANNSKLRLSASLYSYNGDLQTGTMTLEDCLADLADLGCEGVEFLPEAIVPNYPNPPRSWVRQWFKWMEKYNLQPVALDGGADTKLYLHRKLTCQEIVDLIVQDLKLANTLGCRVYRGLGSSWPSALGDESCNASRKMSWSGITPFEIYEKCLPYAEKYNVKMGEELHIPFLIDSEWLEETIAFIDKKGTQYLGFVPDMSIFVRRPPHGLSPEHFIAGGVPKQAVDYIYEARENQVPEDEAKKRAAELGAGPMAVPLTAMVYHLTYSTKERNEPEQLEKVVPYSVHIHAKFYNMLDDLSDEYSIPYSQIVPVLARAGYKNYISSEYEGDRTPFVASNQIRKQHLMLRRMWAAAFTTSKKDANTLSRRAHG